MPNRAAVMTGLGEISIQERPEPTPGPRDAVVRIEAVGVCGSDTAYFKLGRIGDYVVDGPIVLGHEVAGQVEVVGAEVTNVRPGDRARRAGTARSASPGATTCAPTWSSSPRRPTTARSCSSCSSTPATSSSSRRG